MSDGAAVSPEPDPTPTPTPRWRTALSLLVKVGIAAALIAYLAQSGKVRWQDLGDLFRTRPEIALFGFISLFFANVMFSALRWKLLLKASAVEFTLPEVMQLTLIGHFFNTFLPGSLGGDPLKAMYAAKAAPPGRRVEAATTVALDRVIGLITLLGVCAVGLAIQLTIDADNPAFRHTVRGLRARYGGLATIAVTLAVGLALALALLAVPAIRRSRPIEWLRSRMPGAAWIRRAVRTALASVSSWQTIVGAVLLSAASHAITIFVFYVIGNAMEGGTIPGLAHVYVVPVGLTLNALPGPPAGFGVGELAFETLYNLVLDTTHSVGAETCLAWRAVLLCWNLIGGLCYVAWRGKAVSVAEGVDPEAADRGASEASP